MVDEKECKEKTKLHNGTMTFGMVCAVGGKGQGVCQVNYCFNILRSLYCCFHQGDSGGPLTVQEEGSGSHTLAGVVSHGLSGGPEVCGQEGRKYDVYTAVSMYMDWLERTILNNGGLASCSYMLTADPVLGKVSYHN